MDNDFTPFHNTIVDLHLKMKMISFNFNQANGIWRSVGKKAVSVTLVVLFSY